MGLGQGDGWAQVTGSVGRGAGAWGGRIAGFEPCSAAGRVRWAEVGLILHQTPPLTGFCTCGTGDRTVYLLPLYVTA